MVVLHNISTSVKKKNGAKPLKADMCDFFVSSAKAKSVISVKGVMNSYLPNSIEFCPCNANGMAFSSLVTFCFFDSNSSLKRYSDDC